MRSRNAADRTGAACLGTGLTAKTEYIAVREEVCSSREVAVEADTAEAISREALCTSREAEFITGGACIAKMCAENEDPRALGKAELAERYAKHDSELAAFQLKWRQDAQRNAACTRREAAGAAVSATLAEREAAVGVGKPALKLIRKVLCYSKKHGGRALNRRATLWLVHRASFQARANPNTSGFCTLTLYRRA